MNNIHKINGTDKKNYTAKKGNKRPKVILLLKIFVTVVFTLVILTFIAFSPLYEIKEIKASGSEKYTEGEIIRASGVNIGDNGFIGVGCSLKQIFGFGLSKAEQSILKKMPYIREASVRFVIPDKVVISVSDREPFMMVTCRGAYVFLDKDNYILESFKEPQKGYPVVIGIDYSRYEIGQPLACRNPDALDIAKKIINAIIDSDKTEKYEIYDLLKVIDIEDIRNIKLFINDTLVVNLGDIKNIDYKITFLKEAYYSSIKDEKGLLDFTLSKHPTFKR